MVRQQRFATGRRFIGVVVLAVTAGVLGTVPASATPVSVPAPVERLAEAAGHDLVAKQTPRRRTPRPGGPRRGRRGLAGRRPRLRDRHGQGQGRRLRLHADEGQARLRADRDRSAQDRHRQDQGRPARVVLAAVRAHRLLPPHGRPARQDRPRGGHDLRRPALRDREGRLPGGHVHEPGRQPRGVRDYSGHKKNQSFELDLAPGASLTVRADYSTIDYFLTADDDRGSGLGEGTVKVKQSCRHGAAQPGSHALQTTGYVGCAQPAREGGRPAGLVRAAVAEEAALRGARRPAGRRRHRAPRRAGARRT